MIDLNTKEYLKHVLKKLRGVIVCQFHSSKLDKNRIRRTIETIEQQLEMIDKRK